MFQDKAKGVKRVQLSQVWVTPAMKRRVEIMVAKRRSIAVPGYSISSYVREALEAKLEKDLGPEKD